MFQNGTSSAGVPNDTLSLMIAESRMDEMDILVKVVVNLINRKQ